MNRNVLVGNATRADDQNYSVKLVPNADYAILSTDYYDEIWSAPSSANRVVTMPDPTLAINLYRKIKFINKGDGTYKVTLGPFNAETFNVMSGNEEWTLASFELLQSGDWCEFIGNGTNWIKCNAPYWHYIDDPPTGSIVKKIDGWTADSFSGGLLITYTTIPIGTVAVNQMVAYQYASSGGLLYWRKNGDANISNTPIASEEDSHSIRATVTSLFGRSLAIVWVSSDLKVQFAVRYTTGTVWIFYPAGYLQ